MAKVKTTTATNNRSKAVPNEIKVVRVTHDSPAVKEFTIINSIVEVHDPYLDKTDWYILDEVFLYKGIDVTPLKYLADNFDGGGINHAHAVELCNKKNIGKKSINLEMDGQRVTIKYLPLDGVIIKCGNELHIDIRVSPTGASEKLVIVYDSIAVPVRSSYPGETHYVYHNTVGIQLNGVEITEFKQKLCPNFYAFIVMQSYIGSNYNDYVEKELNDIRKGFTLEEWLRVQDIWKTNGLWQKHIDDFKKGQGE